MVAYIPIEHQFVVIEGINRHLYYMQYKDINVYSLHNNEMKEIGYIRYINKVKYENIYGTINIANIRYDFTSTNRKNIILREHKNSRQVNRYKIDTIKSLQRKDKHYVEDKPIQKHNGFTIDKLWEASKEYNTFYSEGIKPSNYYIQLIGNLYNNKHYLSSDRLNHLNRIANDICELGYLHYDYLKWLDKANEYMLKTMIE